MPKIEGIEIVRQVHYDGQVFVSVGEAAKYRARTELSKFATVEELCANADKVVELLKPFRTPIKRISKKQKANGPALTTPKTKGAQSNVNVG